MGSDAGMAWMISLSMFFGASRTPRQCRRGIWTALAFVLIACSAQAQQHSLLDKARDAMNAKQFSVAEQVCRKALVQNPKSVALLTTLGLSVHMQGRSADAIYYYSIALKQGYAPETYALLAAEKCRVGDLEAVRPMLQK